MFQAVPATYLGGPRNVLHSSFRRVLTGARHEFSGTFAASSGVSVAPFREVIVKGLWGTRSEVPE